ncbi:hypothetical protein [Streptomyces sp. NPDC056948]|uniref:hypothetical protein n=1 Tax=Streptomyces sp. NPDC056948 TaxID=3345975 RepID=UPI00363B21B1
MEPTVVVLPLFDEEPPGRSPTACAPQSWKTSPGRTTSWPRLPLLGPHGHPAAHQLHHPAGPPGVGKATIARLLADGSDMAFDPVSPTSPAWPNGSRPRW